MAEHLDITYISNWLNDVDNLFQQLMASIQWQQESISMFGKKVGEQGCTRARAPQNEDWPGQHFAFLGQYRISGR